MSTTFDVSSMTKLDGPGNLKAIANVVINGEIAVNGIKLVESEKGLFPSMPTKSINGEYVEMVHPITAEASQKLKEAVVECYKKLVASGEKTIKNDLSYEKNKPVSSKIDIKLREVDNSKFIKAAGQVTVDDCFVIKDVKVVKPAGKPEFPSMPTYQNSRGEYVEIANPITTPMYEKIKDGVLDKFKKMEKVEYRGEKYESLGNKDKGEITELRNQNNAYAEKLMTKLDAAKIPYHARIGSKSGTTISVNIANKPMLDTLNKQLKEQLAPPQKNATTPKHGR